MSTLSTAPELDLGDDALTSALQAGLARVETELRVAVHTDTPVVGEPAGHLVSAGGRRFRPLLVLLAAHFGDPEAKHVVPAAVVVELTHVATLYHDDVMDEASLRRGAESANSRWDNSVAILTGDFIFARAAAIAADLGPDAVRLLALTFERLVTGQIRETAEPAPGADPVRHYLEVLDDKTASLIATSARFGGEFGGAPAHVVDALHRYGELIGTAFQLSDDLLDIAAETGESGKTPGTDLREGVRTLPVLYALQSTDPAETRLRELLAGPLVEDAAHAEALTLLRKSPAMDEARATLEQYAAEARTVVETLPDGSARRGLASVVDYVVDRTG